MLGWLKLKLGIVEWDAPDYNTYFIPLKKKKKKKPTKNKTKNNEKITWKHVKIQGQEKKVASALPSKGKIK